MTLAKAFGARLSQERREKAARERRDITQRDIAEAVGLTSAAISRYEAGLVIPDDAILQRLADYFGVRRVWLREGEGQRTAIPEHAIEAVERGVTLQDPADAPQETRRAVGQRGKRGRGR